MQKLTTKEIISIERGTKNSISSMMNGELRDLLTNCYNNLDTLLELDSIRPEDDLMIDIAQSAEAQRIINNLYHLAIFDAVEIADYEKYSQLDASKDEFHANLRTAKAFIAMTYSESNLEKLNGFYRIRDEKMFEPFATSLDCEKI